MDQLVMFRLNHNKPYSADEIKVLCMIWFDILSDEKVDMVVFQKACHELRKTSVYFPTINDVLEKCRELTSTRYLEWKDPAKDIDPDDLPSPEQVKANIKKLRDIVSANAKKFEVKY